jgi:hypothetical protein
MARFCHPPPSPSKKHWTPALPVNSPPLERRVPEEVGSTIVRAACVPRITPRISVGESDTENTRSDAEQQISEDLVRELRNRNARDPGNQMCASAVDVHVSRQCWLVRGAAATCAFVLASVIFPPARHAVASYSSFALRGSLTITDRGQAVRFTTLTCREIGVVAARKRVVLRANGADPESRPGRLINTPISQPLTALAPCRLSFRIRDIPSASSYSLTIVGKTGGTWSRAALQQRHWWLFFDAQGDSNPATWHLSEVRQANGGDIPVPDVSSPVGMNVDPIAWRQEWTTTPGTDQHACASVGSRADVRSASFIVGNFNAYRHDWDGTLDTSKLYYVPLHPEGQPPLAVSAQSLDNPSEVVPVLSEYSPAWGATGDFFYATGTVLPHRGRWRLTATAGPDWGCFDLRL